MDLSDLQNNLRSFLSNIMNEPSIKIPYFKYNEQIYAQILSNCYSNLRQDNDEVEFCQLQYQNKLLNLNECFTIVFNQENEKLTNCVENSKTKDDLKNCEEVFKTNYKSGIKTHLKESII
jgi:hypothetical protein